MISKVVVTDGIFTPVFPSNQYKEGRQNWQIYSPQTVGLSVFEGQTQFTVQSILK